MHASTWRLGGAICGFLLLLGAGCASTPDALTPPIGANSRPGEEPLESAAAQRELALSQRMIRAGEYSQAIPRLMHIMNKYPSSPAATDALYFAGIAYYNISGLNDARTQFNQYLQAAPEGSYAASSRQYLATMKDQAEQNLATEAAVDRRIAEVKAESGDKGELPQRLELADLYWKKGQYDVAGKLYEEILAEYPALANDSVVRTRMEKVAEDTYVLLTPSEVLRREAESEPLVIFNTSAFRSGRFESWPATSKERYYTVTGQVTNRGSNTLQEVQVIVTIYGFGSLVYDTQTVAVGTLQPGDTRAFSARFNNFDNIENINRYECIGTYRQ